MPRGACIAADVELSSPLTALRNQELSRHRVCVCYTHHGGSLRTRSQSDDGIINFGIARLATRSFIGDFESPSSDLSDSIARESEGQRESEMRKWLL